MPTDIHAESFSYRTICQPLYYFLRWCPGGIGLFLRQKFYPRLLGNCGKKVLFGRYVTITNPRKIFIGDNVVINDRVTLDAGRFTADEPAILLENKVFIGSRSTLRAGSGEIILRSGSSVGSFCTLSAKNNIHIGEDVLLAAYTKLGLLPDSDNTDPQTETVTAEAGKDISILPGCWLGVRSTVLPGAQIGQGTIIGAHAVVKGSLPSFVIAVGNPAREIRRRFEQEKQQ